MHHRLPACVLRYFACHRATFQSKRARKTRTRTIGEGGTHSRLVRFGEQNPAGARFSRDHTLSWPVVAYLLIKRDTADRYLEFLFNLSFDLGTSGPVREGKSTVDFRFLFIARGKEIVEIVFRIDPYRIGVTERS